MKSLLGYFSPYVRLLELEVEGHKTREDALVNRIIRLTTGYGLDEAPPNVAEEVKQAAELQKEFSKGIPNHPLRPHEVMAEAERESRKLDLMRELAELEAEPDEDVDPNINPVTRILSRGVQ